MGGWMRMRQDMPSALSAAHLEVDIAAQPQYVPQLRVLLYEAPLADAEPGGWMGSKSAH